MKYLFTVFFILFTTFANAQYASVPDTNLRNILKEYFPDCFNGNLLDTVCASTKTGIGVEGQDIKSLEGMQYFTGMESLYCGFNLLKDLNFLPPNLKYLHCSFNEIRVLPALPAGLVELNLRGNMIESIASLPKNLQYLDLGMNSIKSLPSLPSSLKILAVNSNPLTCIPYLPSNLGLLNTDQTYLRCIPNKPAGITSYLPLCDPTVDRYNCQSFPLISGKVFVDINNNGIKDSEELYRKGVKVFIASAGVYTFSNDSGYYELSVNKPDIYMLSTSIPYYFSTPETITTKGFGERVIKDIAIYPTELVKDLEVSVSNFGFPRPGFDIAFKIDIKNTGSLDSPADLSFEFPDILSIDSVSDKATTQSNKLTWHYPNLPAGDNFSIIVYCNLSSDAVLGNTLELKAKVNADELKEHTPENNVDILNLVIRGAYDPNDKQGPAKITPDQLINEEYIDYTIRFQNTGTDTAFTVVIADLLDYKLLYNSFEMISASHPCEPVIKNQQVYFTFSNILLPDSNTNKINSCGYVSFRVKATPSLAVGQSFSNKAEIYFDYNSPIITNTVETIVVDKEPTSNDDKKSEKYILNAYPNPVVDDILYITNDVSYRLHNSHGVQVLEGVSNGTGILMKDFPKGLYLLEMNLGDQYTSRKILIK
ncbi:T9SS type A sorting domain-containing protein [Sporocytophaga myxococcoides]|uniref:T9SS type A sorting domain-containing protein n=1 Tax=Sporocytophaga myxococcoides TaxID=153721 RepID=UPI00040F3FB5|nr:T9SS type A sorting domain-containing protein [Sporocytophaga myxococcoides]